MRRVVVIAIAVLAIAEVFIAYLVIRDRPGEAVETVPPPSQETTSPKPVVTEPPSPAGAVQLWVSEDGRLLRSWLGSCSEAGRARLDLSNAAGVSFDEVALPLLGDADEKPRPQTVRTILSVQAEDADNIRVVASDDKCRTNGYRTEDAGVTWTQVDPSGWYLSVDGSEVRLDDTTLSPGCDALAVVPLRDNPANAKVLCDDGLIIGTNDDGQAWSVLGEIPGARDMIFTSLYDGMAVRQTDECAAEVVDISDAGGSSESLACVVEESQTRVSSIVARGDRVFVAVGADVYRSDDGGHEWFNAEQAE